MAGDRGRLRSRRGRLSESIFSLANEFMGVRGYFDEGYSGDRLQGVYFNNLYEVLHVEHPQVFKGFVTRTCFGVNSVDWLYTRIRLDGELLDLAKVPFGGFVRTLDMRLGTLTREFVWTTASGKQLKLTFVRMLGMVRHSLPTREYYSSPSTLPARSRSGRAWITRCCTRLPAAGNRVSRPPQPRVAEA